jgi:hypothetical protein
MTGRSSWRLLATFSLIFVVSAFLSGQDSGVDRIRLAAPKVTPHYSLPVAPGVDAVSASSPERFLISHYPLARYPSPVHPVVPGAYLFRQMVRSAGIIFSGRVTAVGASSSPSRDASNTVTFQVEDALRSTSKGQILTIQEWAGRWAGGERYRVGERVLLFLYAPSTLGLTSTVAGAMGRFAVDSQGKIVMSPQHIANFAGEIFLNGKTTVPYADFVLAVRHLTAEE